MSFANNGARVKYVKNLERAPVGDSGPSRGDRPLTHMEAPTLSKSLKENNNLKILLK